MQKRTILERAKEVRAIVDAEMSKPLPKISEVKRALGLLGPLLQDIAASIESAERRLDRLEYYIPEKK